MKTSVALFLIVSISVGILGISLDEDLTLTSTQKKVLDEFKEVVKGRLPHKYMYEEIYLIRWLSARNYNLQDAEAMLMQMIGWRKDQKMDKILHEDWSEFRKQFKYYLDGVDKDGRPIVFMDIGEWNIRRAVLAGQGDKIIRMVDYAFEEINTKLRNMREGEGKAVTQYYAIFDMDGFNLVEQGCAACIPYIAYLVTSADQHYPGNLHRTMLINTPEIFQPVLQILKPAMSSALKDSLHVFGRREEGSRALLKDIDEDQLAEDLGGTRYITNYSS